MVPSPVIARVDTPATGLDTDGSNDSSPHDDSGPQRSRTPCPTSSSYEAGGLCPPIEVCERIMDFVVNPHLSGLYAWAHWSQAISNSYGLCLVCRQWLSHARFLLYSRIPLTQAKHFFKLVDGLKRRPANGLYTQILDIHPQDSSDEVSSRWVSVLPHELPHLLGNLQILNLSCQRNILPLTHPSFFKSITMFKHLEALTTGGTFDEPICLGHGLRLALVHPTVRHICLRHLTQGPLSLPLRGQRPGSHLSSIAVVMVPTSVVLSPIFTVLAPCAAQLTRFTLSLLDFGRVSKGSTSEVARTLQSLGHFLKDALSLRELRLPLIFMQHIPNDIGNAFRRMVHLRILQLPIMRYYFETTIPHEVSLLSQSVLALLHNVSSPDLVLVAVIWELPPSRVHAQAPDLAEILGDHRRQLLEMFSDTSRKHLSMGRDSLYFTIEDELKNLVTG
ncbi:hypothetical protein EIP91_005356, partial [Steccherinum ochraceum]